MSAPELNAEDLRAAALRYWEECEVLDQEIRMKTERRVALMKTIQGMLDLAKTFDPPESPAPIVVTSGIGSNKVTRIESPRVDDDYPRGVDAVRRVLVENGGKMTSREIADELLRRNWTPRSSDPLNATSSNAGRAFDTMADIHRERNAQGHFLYWYAPASPGVDDLFFFDESPDDESSEREPDAAEWAEIRAAEEEDEPF
jgi:hypothetical protein